MIIFILLASITIITINASANAATDNASETQTLFEAEAEAEKSFLFSLRGTYKHYCAPCHGETGEGDGIYYSTDLSPMPRNLTDEGHMSTRSETELFKWIKDGSAASGKSNLCPPWGSTLSEETIRNLVSYVRGLSFRSSQFGEKPAADAEEISQSRQSRSPQAIYYWSSSSKLLLLIAISLFIVIVGIYQWRRNRRIETWMGETETQD